MGQRFGATDTFFVTTHYRRNNEEKTIHAKQPKVAARPRPRLADFIWQVLVNRSLLECLNSYTRFGLEDFLTFTPFGAVLADRGWKIAEPKMDAEDKKYIYPGKRPQTVFSSSTKAARNHFRAHGRR